MKNFNIQYRLTFFQERIYPDRNKPNYEFKYQYNIYYCIYSNILGKWLLFVNFVDLIILSDNVTETIKRYINDDNYIENKKAVISDMPLYINRKVLKMMFLDILLILRANG